MGMDWRLKIFMEVLTTVVARSLGWRHVGGPFSKTYIHQGFFNVDQKNLTKNRMDFGKRHVSYICGGWWSKVPQMGLTLLLSCKLHPFGVLDFVCPVLLVFFGSFRYVFSLVVFPCQVFVRCYSSVSWLVVFYFVWLCIYCLFLL